MTRPRVESDWLNHAPELFESIRRAFRVGSHMTVSLDSLDGRNVGELSQIGGFAMAQMQAIHHLLTKTAAERSLNDHKLILQHANALLSFLSFARSGSIASSTDTTSGDWRNERALLARGATHTQALVWSAFAMTRSPQPPEILRSEM